MSIMDGILRHALHAHGWSKRHVVLSVAKGPFTRLGFTKVIPDIFDVIDPLLA